MPPENGQYYKKHKCTVNIILIFFIYFFIALHYIMRAYKISDYDASYLPRRQVCRQHGQRDMLQDTDGDFSILAISYEIKARRE